MKISKLSFFMLVMLASFIAPRFASAVIVAPYTAGVHTLHLYHMDAAVAPLLDTGTAATLYNLTNVSAATGVSSYIGFGNALSYTANPDLAKTATNSQASWQGSDGAFTYEATIYVTTALSAQAIQTVMARDHTAGGGPNDRSFILRLNNASGIEFINTGASTVQTVAMPLPTTGPNVFTVNNWYHIAVTYNGVENTANNISFYWTKLDNAVTNANLLGTSQLNADVGEVIGSGTTFGNPFVVGNRDNVSGSNFRGLIDEVRISDLARAADEMLFASPDIMFLTQPSNQVVAVNRQASFSATVKGPGPLSYQWYSFDATATNAISGATNTTLNIQAGSSVGITNYFLVATNSLATAPATSSIVTLTIRLPFSLTWAGGGSAWDTSTANWTTNNNVSQTFYTEADNVTFNNLGAAQPNVDLQQSFSPTSVTVSNSSADYLLYASGANSSLTTLGTVMKQGAGKFTIDVTNNSTGLTLVQNGILQVGNGDSYGTLGSGPVTNNATLSFNRSDAALTVANAIHGSGALSFDGSGTVTVTGTNDYTGSTLINAGVVNLGNAAGLGDVSGGTTVANGGQLYITANADIGAESLSLGGSGGDGSGGLRKGGGGLTTFGGPLTLTADSTIGVDGGATITLNNPLGISGSFALTKNGNGTLALNATNHYAATTLAAGVINVNTNGALGTGPVTATTSGRFVIGTGMTIINTFVATTVNPGVATGFIMVNDNTNGTVTTVSGPLSFGGNPLSGGTFVGPTTSGYLNITGGITNPPGTAMSVRFGNVRFSGGGDYPFLEARSGTTSIGANNGVATNAVIDLAGNGLAFLDLNGHNQTLGGLKNAVTPGNAYLGFVTNSSLTAATLTLDPGTGFSYSSGSSLAGNLSLVLQSGTQVITGTNAYTGNTTVNNGILEIAQPTLAASSTVSVTNGATLQLDFSVTNKVAALVLGGASQPLGVYDSATPPGSGFLSGPGFIQVAVPVATNPTNITAVVNGNNLELYWPLDHQGWRLQAQTNLLSTGLGTNWVDVPNTAGVTSVTNTISPANGSVFYRMIYP